VILFLLVCCKTEDPVCRLNSDCAANEQCREGVCSVECREDRDCPSDQGCTTNRCVIKDPPVELCSRSADCPSGQICQAGICGTITFVHNDAGVSADATVPGFDASAGEDGGVSLDASVPADGGAALLPYGAVCMRASECESNLCLGPANATSGRCTRSCTGDLDCFYPDQCVEIPGNGFFCGPATSGLASGEPCPNGPSSCSTGLCITVPPSPPLCTHQCSPLPSCPSGMICEPVDDGSGGAIAVCIPGSGLGFGDACIQSSACSSGLCVGLTQSGTGVCTSLCDQLACPAGWTCTGVNDGAGNTVYVCAASGLSGGGFGAACTGALECASGLCLNDARIQAAFCTASCASDADCAQVAGLVCVQLSSGDQVCAPP
jgi:Cys-rich repeat protein